MTEFPIKVKCPHCDHLTWRDLHSTRLIASKNIMLHIKNKHPEIQSLGCPFCEEYFAQYKLLEHHVRTAHKWRPQRRKRETEDFLPEVSSSSLVSKTDATNEESKAVTVETNISPHPDPYCPSYNFMVKEAVMGVRARKKVCIFSRQLFISC